MTLSDALRITGPVDLAAHDSRATTGFDGDKADAEAAMTAIDADIADLQEKLFANGRSDATDRKVLLLLQGMDTSGKGGTISHVAGAADPQGLHITSFKKPTPEELEHDFLWRIGQALPEPGMVGVFDRSQYEDVLIGRVRELAPADEIEARYDAINAFEREFVDGGGVLVKCFLHITADDQLERLAARLEDPTKYWKYNAADLDERALWDQYQEAYAIALERCSTEAAPWHLVPSGRKWYRNWAVGTLLVEALRSLDLGWPAPTFDLETEKKRVAAL